MYKGIVCPMITPLDAHGNIDYNATNILIKYLEGINVDYLFPMGSTGVFPYFTLKERKDFLKFVRENSKKPIMAGVGSSSINEVNELMKFSMDIGIEAAVLMPPYYIKLNQEAIYHYYKEILSSNDMDLLIYNIPQFTNKIDPETVKNLKSEFSSVKGVKDSSADIRGFMEMLSLSDDDFAVFQGQDDLLFTSLELGASGGVCGTTNFSDGIVRLYHEYKNNREMALKIEKNDVIPLMKKLGKYQFPNAYYEYFYKKNNINGGYRPPMYRVGIEI
ncbi:dihydrodipicolinate synthase family protein [Picrophilus oshimae]|nr:dihydrodipicolinate synthase family protein [Picrophilus oshimae]SMD31067.1 2-keto-3-deoxygluconate aldolase [Picrophilus oshimae DSM 9789]